MERIIQIALLLSALFATTVSMAQERKKVAVVLSGGGAKGMAHIGALKVMEEAGIPIDYIVGTSIGSIVGGLYAIGYTPSQLDSMVRKQDWTRLLSDKVDRKRLSLDGREDREKYIISMPFDLKKQKNMEGLVQGENLNALFSDLTVGYHDSIDFNRLPVPFACVATDIVSGNEIVFHNGVLSTAIRASMAIPGVFTPVRKDSMVLVDGGLKNNYPADVAREMGADIVIGINVQNEPQKAGRLNKVTDILTQVIDLACKVKLESNMKQTDLFIKVNTEGYTVGSFNKEAIDSLIVRGEEAVRSQLTALYALKEKAGIGEEVIPRVHGPYASLSSIRTVFIDRIHFTDVEEKEIAKILRKSRLKERSMNSVEQIGYALDVLREELGYSNVYYTLEATEDGHDLYFQLDRKIENRLNVGIRFDTEEIASLLLNVRSRLHTGTPSTVSLTGRLGKRYMANLKYTLEPSLMKHLDFSYTYRYNDLNVYRNGTRTYNTTYHQHTAEACYSDVWFRNFRYDAGWQFEYFHHKDLLYSISVPEFPHPESRHFFNYFVRLRYNTLDKGYYPSGGIDFQAGYTVYTDNMAQYDGHSPFSAVHASWRAAFSFGSRFALLPFVYGRALIGRGVSDFYGNVIGGDVFARYLPQQLPFVGIHNIESVKRSILAGGLKLRQRLAGKHYVTISGNIGMTDDKFQNILRGKYIYGFSLGYGFDSDFGPLEASIGYSDHTDDVKSYINLGFFF